MQTIKKYFDLFNSAKSTLLTLGVIIVAILNLWLSTKLSPLATNVESINSRVIAVEDNLAVVENHCSDTSNVVGKKIDKLEAKLQIIDDRNLDIYKILISR